MTCSFLYLVSQQLNTVILLNGPGKLCPSYFAYSGHINLGYALLRMLAISRQLNV